MTQEKPVFLQIIEMIEDDILAGVYLPGNMIISTTQISKLLGVNPTTAVKAVSILTDKGIVTKKRGLGMAVTENARQIITKERKQLFFTTAIPEFISYAEKIGISKQDLVTIIEGEQP